MHRAIVSFAAAFFVALGLAAAADTPSAPKAVASPSPAIVVYEQPDFKGRTLTLVKATPDLGPLGFDNKVASLAIAGGDDWVLCENRNYTGRCVRVQDKASDLSAFQLWNRVSSLYPVPKVPAPTTP